VPVDGSKPSDGDTVSVVTTQAVVGRHWVGGLDDQALQCSQAFGKFSEWLSQLTLPSSAAQAAQLGVSQLMMDLYIASNFVLSDGTPVVVGDGREEAYPKMKPGTKTYTGPTLTWPKSVDLGKPHTNETFETASEQACYLVSEDKLRSCTRKNGEKFYSVGMDPVWVVNHWRPTATDGHTPELQKMVGELLVGGTLVMKDWADVPRIVFVEYPRPTFDRNDERWLPPGLWPEIKRTVWDSILVNEAIHVEPKKKVGEPYVVTLYGRCAVCGKQVLPSVTMDETDAEALLCIDWAREIVETESDEIRGADPWGARYGWGHLCRPEHHSKWADVGGALSAVMGIVPNGLGQRYQLQAPHRHPYTVVVGDVPWFCPVGIECSAFPSFDSLRETIGDERYFLLSVRECLLRGECVVKLKPKEFHKINVRDVAKLHVGLVYWKTGDTQADGPYQNPNVRYIRLAQAPTELQHYFSDIVKKFPTWSDMHPEQGIHGKFNKAKYLGKGPADVRSMLYQYPPGNPSGLSWWYVVEIEFYDNSDMKKLVKTKIFVICMDQNGKPTYVSGLQYFEFWAVPVARFRADLKDSVWK